MNEPAQSNDNPPAPTAEEEKDLWEESFKDSTDSKPNGK